MCHIISKPIDLPALEARSAGACGGFRVTCTTTAGVSSNGKVIASLEYDAYVPMAERMMREIAAVARERWSATIAVEHRIGPVSPGEVVLAVCACAEHSDEAFEACRYCVDELNKAVPIWRKELRADGAFWIEGEDAIRAER